MEKNLTQEAIGWTAFALNSYFLLFPTIPFYNLIKGKLNFEDAPGAYAAINYLNCLCWFLYSDLLISDQIKVINLIGMVASGIYVLIYLFYEIRVYKLDTILNTLILGSGTYMIYLSLTDIIEDDTVIGKICFGTHCLLFFFPIQNIYQVIKQKNFMLIPFCSAWGSMFMSICWILYGIMITEIYLVLPHCINIILATVQIIMFLNYRKKYPIFENKEFPTSTIEYENHKNEDNNNNKREENEETEYIEKEKPVKIIENDNNLENNSI